MRVVGVLAVLPLAAGLLVGGPGLGCSAEESSPAESQAAVKVQVVATIFPLADAVRQVGGEDVKVRCLLKPGQSPGDFRPEAEHLQALRRARLVVTAGMGLDGWVGPAMEQANAKNVAVIEFAADPYVRRHIPVTQPTTRSGREPAPHGADGQWRLWLDPVLMRQFVRRIAQALAMEDPTRLESYMFRRDKYIDELRKLDADYRAALAGVKDKYFVTYHRSFRYVAQRYGLKQWAISDMAVGGISPQNLEELVQVVKSRKVRAIFVEPRFPAAKLGALLRRTGAKTWTLDPLGGPGKKGHDSYLAMMRSNLAQLAAGLKD